MVPLKFRLEKRPEPSRLMLYATPVGAVILTMVVGAIIFSAIGYNGVGAVYQEFLAPVLTPYKWQDIAIKASPLILIGVGLAAGNRAAIWNIGAEGQYVVGALAGAGIGLLTQNATGPWILPAMLLAGIIGGAVWGAIPALLRTRFNVNETLSSLMMTYVAIHLMNYLVAGPWKDPSGFSFPQTPLVTSDQTLPSWDIFQLLHQAFGLAITGHFRLHLGVVLTLVIVLVMAVVMGRSVFGFQIRVVGAAPNAARHGGFSQQQTIWLVFLLSGALAGLAGIFEVTGPFGQMSLGFPQNYGFTAIIVAFLGRLNPIGVIIAGIVLAITYVGGDMAQSALQLPNASKGIFQAMMLFFLLASDILIRYRVRLVTPAGGLAAEPVTPAKSAA
ncbi:MAG TPA: ABC transporter permease [Devosiaceae bacterium]|nr:ABC transporter permease [Devosiaceae bacterium]